MDGLSWLPALPFALGCLALALRLRRKRRQLEDLSRQVEQFLTQPEQPLPPALREDSLARLQDGIGRLQQALLLEKQKTQAESHRTSQLIAHISHQLKTPLTTLRLYTELDQSPHMAPSLEQIQRMETLLQALLRLERLWAHGYPFTFAPAQLAEIVREQWQNLQPLWPDRQLLITGSAAIRCDASWLGEAILNLLKNACQHTGPGGTLRVKLEQTQAACFFTLEDEGGGAGKEDLPHLFQPFYRGREEKHTGSGLGLAIVRQIVQHHHGTVSAENGETGLKVTICLPTIDGHLTTL